MNSYQQGFRFVVSFGKFFFAPFLSYQWGEYIDLEGKIRVTPKDSENLLIQLWKSDTLCCETVLKGRQKGNYFEINRRLKMLGFPLLFFKSEERKILLSINESGDLILKEGSYGIGNIFLFSGGSQNYTSFEYARID